MEKRMVWFLWLVSREEIRHQLEGILAGIQPSVVRLQQALHRSLSLRHLYPQVLQSQRHTWSKQFVGLFLKSDSDEKCWVDHGLKGYKVVVSWRKMTKPSSQLRHLFQDNLTWTWSVESLARCCLYLHSWNKDCQSYQKSGFVARVCTLLASLQRGFSHPWAWHAISAQEEHLLLSSPESTHIRWYSSG